jgi:hypothetical protein
MGQRLTQWVNRRPTRRNLHRQAEHQPTPQGNLNFDTSAASPTA